MRVAVIDDWQGVARDSADWSALQARAPITIFQEAFADEDAAATALADFGIVMAMRERTAFPASLIARLPKLRMLSITGPRTRSVDRAACAARGIFVSCTGAGEDGAATAELALALMLAATRRVAMADATVRAGGFQGGVPAGFVLAGRTLGVLGLGRLGTRMAGYGAALGMPVIAWSPNLTAEHAAAAGATLVTKDALFAEAQVVSVHLVSSPPTAGLVGAHELGLMRKGAILVNTSRGPIVQEAALLAALAEGRIIAALDVYDTEPLPPAHPLRRTPNTVLTPHLGYCVEENYAVFHAQAIENVLAFLDGAPIRPLGA
jgi:phosphoglycerate dehydrogenase-like enzyme